MLYRQASPRAHGEVTGCDSVGHKDARGRLIVQAGEDRQAGLIPLAIAVFAMALLLTHHRLGWPDTELADRIGAALTHEDSEPAT